MSNGVAHRVLDEITKFKAMVSGKMSELINKHNDLAAKQAALEGVVQQMAGFVAAEMGKSQGQVQGQMQVIGRSLSGIDLNVLALAELNKEVIGQLTQIDAYLTKLATDKNSFDLSDEEVTKVKSDAEAWYADLLKSSFDKAAEKIRKQEEQEAAYRAAEQKAAEEQAKILAEKAEKDSIESELKKAEEMERRVVSSTSGGEGSSFPEGAEIFGG